MLEQEQGVRDVVSHTLVDESVLQANCFRIGDGAKVEDAKGRGSDARGTSVGIRATAVERLTECP